MNNGRYWTLMDQGRMDLMLRSGCGRRSARLVGHSCGGGQDPVRRELRPFVRFGLETRILCWSDTTMVIEHRFGLASARTGQTVVNATALVRAGLYDRKANPMCGRAHPRYARLDRSQSADVARGRGISGGG